MLDQGMIADTSTLIAASIKEKGHEALRAALTSKIVRIPAPVIVEFERVTALADNMPDQLAHAFLAMLFEFGAMVIAFDAEMAKAAAVTNAAFGSGSGHKAKLNLLDLMMHGVAKVMNLPIFCTGSNFAATDAAIHPASRVG